MSPRRCPPRAGVLAASLVVAAFASAPAAAQSRDTGAGTELFEKGRAAMKVQDYATACAAFADSQRFDAKVGTLLNLADCEERLKRLISARAHWQQAADLAHAVGDARENVARQRFMALDPRVAKLAVRLAGGAPSGAVVRRDDVELGAGSLGVALPADPGAHTIVVSAQGYDPSTTSVTLGEGEVQEVVVAPGAKLPAPVSAAPVAPEPPPSAPVNVQRSLGVVLGLAGLAAGVSVGTYFGLKARSANDASYTNGACDSANTCDPAGLDERSAALRDGTISTIAFIAGGVLAAGGLVIWLTSPSSPGDAGKAKTGLLLSPRGVAWGGGF